MPRLARAARARPVRPMRKRRGMKYAKRGLRNRRRLVPRTTDRAILVEGAENQLTLGNDGTYGFTYTTSLANYQRAQEVAHAYKYYRCAKIELQFVPYANISTVGGGAGNRLPQLYFTVDRVANQWIVPTEAEMIERGVSPKLFKRKMVFTWKPNLLQNVQLEVNQPGDGGNNPLGVNVIGAVNSIPIFNKWLPTQQSYGYTAVPPNSQIGQTVTQPSQNPYALRYYGAAFVIDQEGGAAQVIGDLISKVTWEFKGPRALKTNNPDPQLIVSPATSMMNPGRVANTQPTNYP